MEALDDVFELLTKERRRFALYYLEDQDGPVSVTELASAIEEWETNGNASTVPDDRYDEIVLTLQHTHLPKAAEVEFVEYDPRERSIELTGCPSEFQVILSVAEAIEQPRQEDITTIL